MGGERETTGKVLSKVIKRIRKANPLKAFLDQKAE